MGNQATKTVRIILVAHTRVEFSETIRVPADITEHELAQVVDKRYADVDPSLYTVDNEYWERSPSTRHEFADIDDNDTARMRVLRRCDGVLTLAEVPGTAASAPPPCAQEVADQFCKLLRKALTPGQIDRVNASNKANGYSSSQCASHDFCDANMVMSEAFEALGIGSHQKLHKRYVEQSTLIDLWNQAWALAKRRDFQPSTDMVCVDMTRVAERILNNYSGSIQPNGAPIVITAGTRLHRFGLFENGAMVEPDKLHILVDGGGGFTATIDPDTPTVCKRDGHLSEFASITA